MNILSYIYICTHTLHGVYVQEIEERVEKGKVAVSYSVSESAGMMANRARDNSHTPYESAGMIESDPMRVVTPLGL